MQRSIGAPGAWGVAAVSTQRVISPVADLENGKLRLEGVAVFLGPMHFQKGV